MSPALQVRQADLDWFKANLDRRFRVRRLAIGEDALANFDVSGDCLSAMVLYRFQPNKIAAWCVQISALPDDTEDDARELLIAVGMRIGLVRADA